CRESFADPLQCQNPRRDPNLSNSREVHETGPRSALPIPACGGQALRAAPDRLRPTSFERATLRAAYSDRKPLRACQAAPPAFLPLRWHEPSRSPLLIALLVPHLRDEAGTPCA